MDFPRELRRAARVAGFGALTAAMLPGFVAHPPYDGLLSGRVSPAAYEAASPMRVGPVFDDNPFYFAIERPWGMSTNIATLRRRV